MARRSPDPTPIDAAISIYWPLESTPQEAQRPFLSLPREHAKLGRVVWFNRGGRRDFRARWRRETIREWLREHSAPTDDDLDALIDRLYDIGR